MENNKASVSGEVVSELRFSHDCFGERFYVCDLKINRESGAYDVIHLLVSDRVEIFKDINIGSYLIVEGTIRTYDDNERHLNTSIMVETVQLIDEFDMLIDDNKIELKGFICKKDQLRKTPKGKYICNVILAVNRPYGKSDYIPCIFWGKLAKTVDKFEVGQEVSITGRFQSRQYIKNNKEKIAYELSVQSLYG